MFYFACNYKVARQITYHIRQQFFLRGPWPPSCFEIHLCQRFKDFTEALLCSDWHRLLADYGQLNSVCFGRPQTSQLSSLPLCTFACERRAEDDAQSVWKRKGTLGWRNVLPPRWQRVWNTHILVTILKESVTVWFLPLITFDTCPQRLGVKILSVSSSVLFKYRVFGSHSKNVHVRSNGDCRLFLAWSGDLVMVLPWFQLTHVALNSGTSGYNWINEPCQWNDT